MFMNELLEKFRGYLIEKYYSESIEGTPYMDLIFRFENGYGALLIVERFANFDLYDVATIKFIDGGDKFDFVKAIPERHILAIMCKPIEKACEFLEMVKGLK